MPPADIVHVNAHATSTPPGDIAESQAIRRALGDDADGVCVSAHQVDDRPPARRRRRAWRRVVTVLALHDRKAPVTANLEDPDDAIPLDIVSGEPRTLRAGDIAALNNSFGFGGHNVALVFRTRLSRKDAPGLGARRGAQPVWWSQRTGPPSRGAPERLELGVPRRAEQHPELVTQRRAVAAGALSAPRSRSSPTWMSPCGPICARKMPRWGCSRTARPRGRWQAPR